MPRSDRRSVLALIGCAAVAASALPLYALAAPDVSRAPDLRADPVERVSAPQVYLDGQMGTGANRLLVRFDGFVTNVGGGPLEIRGNPRLSQSAAGGVKQYALAAGVAGSRPTEAVATPEVKYESTDGHDHFHLMRVMRYSLWNLSGTAEVAPGQKVGFCLYDLDDGLPAPAPPPAPQVYTEAVTRFCESGNEESTNLRMGVSSGWRDVYNRDLAFQWIDVSSTPPGVYLVGSEADPDDVIWEGGGRGGPETNPRTLASTRVTVPGHVAQPVRVAQTGAPRSIPLASTPYGTPGPVRYQIVDGPDHGTLDQATGGPAFAGPAVVYTPAAGYSGADAFSFIALDPASLFPRAGSAPRATASITAAAPSITISGVPARLIAGTSAQLSAIVSHAGGGVTWSASAGSVSPGGLYVAPATPPPGGTVTVRATSDTVSGLAAEAAISIAPVPPSSPAPVPVAAAAPAAPPARLLSKLTFARAGGRAVIATLTTGRRAGRITVTMTNGKKVVGRCGARVTANRTVSCRIVVPRRFALARTRATATIAFSGTVAAVRRAKLTPPSRRS